MHDCSFVKDNKQFRYRSAAIIIEEGQLLFATNQNADYLYSIGGAVHHGETAEAAVLREVFEETGVRYEISRLAVIHENFFIERSGPGKGTDCHEISFYYFMKPRGTRRLCSRSMVQGVKEEMRWVPLEELGRCRAYPGFLKDYLQKERPGILHIVTDERPAP